MSMWKSIYETGPSGLVWDARVDIRSDLPAEEAARRLAESFEDTFSTGRLAEDVLVGYVRSGNLVVSRARPTMRKAFKPVLRASIEPTDEGCRIQGRYTLSRFVAVFIVFWFAFLGMVGTIVGVLAVAGETGEGSLPVLGVVGVLVGFGVLVGWLGMYIGEGDTAVIETRIRQELREHEGE